MTALRTLGELDRTFAWDGVRLYEEADLGPEAAVPLELRGAAASVRSANEGWRIVRDPLGINKLFWVEADGTLWLTARLWRLTQAGHELDAIQAIPRGVVIDADPAAGDVARHSIPLDARNRGEADIPQV